MPQTLRIVVTCSARKRGYSSRSPRLGSISARDHRLRLERWRTRLEASEATGKAIDIYAGEHWSIAAGLPEVARARGVRPALYVCSAGYGLIEADRFITPYGASFASGHTDSVARLAEDVVEINRWWWTRMCAQSKTGGVEGLARSSPRTPLLLALSGTYLDALEPDLVRARAALAQDDLMTIISVGASGVCEALKDVVVAAPGTLRYWLGGTLGALNARLAERALAHMADGRIDRAGFEEEIRSRARRVGRPEEPRGRSLPTDEIRGFIKRHAHLAGSQSRMLRLLRESGFACEQGRFREIYQATFEAGRAG